MKRLNLLIAFFLPLQGVRAVFSSSQQQQCSAEYSTRTRWKVFPDVHTNNWEWSLCHSLPLNNAWEPLQVSTFCLFVPLFVCLFVCFSFFLLLCGSYMQTDPFSRITQLRRWWLQLLRFLLINSNQ